MAGRNGYPDPRKSTLFVGVAVLALCAAPALANPGTAAWTGIMMLVFGNFIIGLIEGGVAKACGARWWAFPTLVVANYVSAWAGWTIVWSFGLYWGIFDTLGGEPLQHAIPAMWITFVALSALGVLIEAPFYWLVFLKTPRPRARKVLLALVTANLVTGTGLAVYYAVNTQSSLVSELRVVDDPFLVGSDIVGEHPWVYYIAADEHTVRRVRIDGTSDELVRRTDDSLVETRLLAYQRDTSPIMLAFSSPGEGSALEREILGDRELTEIEDEWSVLRIEADIGDRASLFERDREYGIWPSMVAPFGPAADLRPEEQRTFEVTSSWDGWRGIMFGGVDAPPSLSTVPLWRATSHPLA